MDLNKTISQANEHLAKKELDKAENLLRKATDELDEWIVFFNLATVLSTAGKQDEALQFFKEAEKRGCDEKAMLYHNRGLCYKRKGNLKKAACQYRKSIAEEHVNPNAHNNLATCLIELGEWEEGYSEWEWRLLAHQKSVRIRNLFPVPDWSGDLSSGSRVLVYNEQGNGDAIQNARFLSILKKRGLTTTVMVRPELVRLLSNCVGADRVVENGAKTKYDCVASINSLGLFYGVTTENVPKAPYLFPKKRYPLPSSFWEEREDKLKVGFCYAGSSSHPNDFNRSVPRSMFRRFDMEGVELFCLQKSISREQADRLHDDWDGFTDMAPYMTDFNDTAHIIQKMDIVVSVDTAVAHLAGALEKHTWLMLPTPSDPRWMRGGTTPWYRWVYLFRQDKDGWEKPFEKAENNLRTTLLSLA
jgi:ADP-heptose:LPS heptosyltransferase